MKEKAMVLSKFNDKQEKKAGRRGKTSQN